jgi:hypothetical protein
MAVTACVTDQFKLDVLSGVHQSGDTYKVALYTALAATLNQGTATYTSVGELATALGYTQNSKTLSGRAVALDVHSACLDFDDPVWTGASFTADTALIYNSSKSNAAIAVLSFTTETATSTFTVQLPAPGAHGAIVLT